MEPKVGAPLATAIGTLGQIRTRWRLTTTPAELHAAGRFIDWRCTTGRLLFVANHHGAAPEASVVEFDAPEACPVLGCDETMIAPQTDQSPALGPWFAPYADPVRFAAFGFRLAGGGAHQSKTMMLAELTQFLMAEEAQGVQAALASVEDENLLGKRTAAARYSAFRQLNQLYGLTAQPPVQTALRQLWRADPTGRPMLALLCALARDPQLRQTAPVVLETAVGGRVDWPMLAGAIAADEPARYRPATLKSLAQNCASSWTQSGHLRGTRNKKRVRAYATPEAAAFAVLLARRAGFGGPTLLNSIWMAVLDVAVEERMSLLRLAQGRGLVRVRQAGSVLDIESSIELTIDLAEGARAGA